MNEWLSNFNVVISKRIANPPAPYMIQNALNPNFVPTIVLWDSKQGDPHLSRSCRSIEKRQFPDKSSIFDEFLTKLGPPDGNPEKQLSGQILEKFEVWGFFECCKGREGLLKRRMVFMAREAILAPSLKRKTGPGAATAPAQLQKPLWAMTAPEKDDFEEKEVLAHACLLH